MKKENRDRKSEWPEFLRYRSDNLSGKEKNAFERELNKDPFAMEAAEGFESSSAEQVSVDLKELETRLLSRTSGHRSSVIYRVAATVAVLITISSLFFLLRKDSDLQVEEKPLSLAVSEQHDAAIKTEEKGDRSKEMMVAEDSETHGKSKSGNIKEGPSGKMEPSSPLTNLQKKESVAGALDRKEELISDEKEKDDFAEQVLIPAGEKADMVTETWIVKGKVISAEDNLAIPGASISIIGKGVVALSDNQGNFNLPVMNGENVLLIASYVGMESKEINITSDSLITVNLEPSRLSLSEVAVTGYGAKRAAEAASPETRSKTAVSRDISFPRYKPAEPVEGQAEFNKYIEKNIRIPADKTEGTKVVVIVSLIVRLNGIPDSITVVRSPGKQYSDEAVRLIMQGPLWRPAEEDGTLIEEETRVRIVFR